MFIATSDEAIPLLAAEPSQWVTLVLLLACKVAFAIVGGWLLDIPLRHVEPESLGMLARTQAAADLSILIERGRRCMHLHLPDNSGVTIRALGDAVMKVLDEIERERAAE